MELRREASFSFASSPLSREIVPSMNLMFSLWNSMRSFCASFSAAISSFVFCGSSNCASFSSEDSSFTGGSIEENAARSNPSGAFTFSPHSFAAAA